MGRGRRRFDRFIVAACLLAAAGPAVPAGAQNRAPVPPAPPEAARYCQLGTRPIKGLKTTEKVVTFTFDDGPSPVHTRQVMDVFEAYGYRATFFMVASASRTYSALLKEVVARGFEIGNHSSTHSMDHNRNVAEVRRANDQFQKWVGIRPIFYRAPGLGWTKKLIRTVGANGMCPIDTGTAIQDWKSPKPPAAVYCQRFKDQLAPGVVVILHAGGRIHGETVKALPCMLDYAEQQGYRVLPMREFLDIAGGDPAKLVLRPSGTKKGAGE